MLPWKRPWRSHSCSSLRNQTLSSALCIWQSFVRRSPLVYRIMDFPGRKLPDMPYSALLDSTVDTCLRQSTSLCFLLVVMHLALCSLACRPFVADNSGSARLVLLVPKQLALCSLSWSSGPRCATSWPVWTRRTENSPVAPQQAPCIWQSLVRCWSCLRCTGLWTVLGDDSRNGFHIQHSFLGSTVDTSSASVYEACWKNSHVLCVKVAGPAILECSRGRDSRQLQFLVVWTRSLTCPLACREHCGFSAVAAHRQGLGAEI